MGVPIRIIGRLGLSISGKKLLKGVGVSWFRGSRISGHGFNPELGSRSEVPHLM